MYNQMVFEAGLHGVNLNEEVGNKTEKAPVEKQDNFVFGSPDDYAHLSMEERKELTQKMIGKHKFKFG